MNLDLKHPLAFVPTMGALHAGHQSLIEIAKSHAPNILVSVFVNPLQFENPADLEKYPRDLAGDIEKAESVGASFVWAPTIEEIYPEQPNIIPAGELGDKFEGVHRFGHFDGVLTVVKRLFDLSSPEFAIFGEKDFQQLFLIKQMVNSLKLPIKIISAPIIREPDGLAMSSRNIRLSENGRNSALVISRALKAASEEATLANAEKILHGTLAQEKSFALDYAEIIDEITFEKAHGATTKPRALIAGWVDEVRLIDNMVMNCGKQA
jgi:pantoate--beta-alanine ligase